MKASTPARRTAGSGDVFAIAGDAVQNLLYAESRRPIAIWRESLLGVANGCMGPSAHTPCRRQLLQTTNDSVKSPPLCYPFLALRACKAMNSASVDTSLERWLGPLSRADFERYVFRQAPWARPGAADLEAASFLWPALGELLESRPPPDVLVVARSQLLSHPEPRSLTSLRALMSGGIGICVRHAEQHHEVVAGAAAGLARAFGTTVHVQVFVTPAETHGFGWHYDAEDVFIVQTAGCKDYYFRENTVAGVGRDVRPEFSAIARERSPLHTARLVPGDCLYLPAGFWHMARSVQDSLSMSIGVHSAECRRVGG